MNTTWKFASDSDRDHLAEIKSIRARLLRESPLPAQAGFAFLSLSEGMAAPGVPPQDLEKWYPEVGWVHPAKETLARSPARKYGLTQFPSSP